MRTMKYSELPNYSIICYSNNTLLGKAQKKLIGAKITHVATKRNTFVLENSITKGKNGAQHTLFIDTLAHANINELYALIPLFKIDNIKAIGLVNVVIDSNIKYSVKELFYLLIYKFTNVWIGDTSEITSVCSSFTAWFFNELVDKFPNPYSYSPQKIFDEAELNGFKIVKIEI